MRLLFCHIPEDGIVHWQHFFREILVHRSAKGSGIWT
jgi:hypothetical protein